MSAQTDLYRELHETLGTDKTLDKVLLREVAADQLGDALSAAPDWTEVSQLDSSATGDLKVKP